MNTENKLKELADELRTLREAEEACDYALHYIREVESGLPTNMHMSHHAEMEMEDVHCELLERLEELEDKIEAI